MREVVGPTSSGADSSTDLVSAPNIELVSQNTLFLFCNFLGPIFCFISLGYLKHNLHKNGTFRTIQIIFRKHHNNNIFYIFKNYP